MTTPCTVYADGIHRCECRQPLAAPSVPSPAPEPRCDSCGHEAHGSDGCLFVYSDSAKGRGAGGQALSGCGCVSAPAPEQTAAPTPEPRRGFDPCVNPKHTHYGASRDDCGDTGTTPRTVTLSQRDRYSIAGVILDAARPAEDSAATPEPYCGLDLRCHKRAGHYGRCGPASTTTEGQTP